MRAPRAPCLKDLDKMPAAIKVSAQSTSKKVAAALAHIARAKHDVQIQAISPSNLNTAIKAVAIARTYLAKDGIDCAFTIEFRDDKHASFTIKFVVFQQRFDAFMDGQMHVKMTTKPEALAGALCARLRDSASPVVSCIGAGIVNKALIALALATQYMNTIIYYCPFFENEPNEKGEKLTVLKIGLIKA